ncbi:hypothetical protein PWT90_05927 [Aphanocladium album]|nr:hypothetical protein PWT90_05927 [Aphanocladium album]
MFAKSIAVSGLAAIASAHILMTNPVPYGKSSLTNGPLDASGSDFPCKQREGVYDAQGASNVYAQGSKQQLEFQGTAVHGGGSCQVSVTTDLKPTKNSVWKVIKSIEGGCPAKGQTGNMGNSASAAVPYKYDFTIPNELAAGNYTIAWTWFNKVGNREMYMNCAPMSVTGNSGSQSFMNGLPDMMVANIGNGCKTPDGSDAKFPDPGKDVDRFNGQTDAFSAPVGSCGKTGAPGSAPTSAPAGGNAPVPTTSAASAPSAQPTPAQPSPSIPTSGGSAPGGGSRTGVPGGVFITSSESEPAPTQMPGSGNSSVPAMSSSMPVPTSAPANPGSGASPSGGVSPAPVPTGGSGSGNGSSPSGGHAAGSACTSEGAWNCIGGKSFQRCASGMWSAVQAMAAGVSCESGESADLKMAAAVQGRRTMRRALRIRA